MSKILKTLIVVCIFISTYANAQESKEQLLLNAKKVAFEGKPNEAAKLFEQALALDSVCDACYYELANIYAQNGKYTKAKKNAEKAYYIDPTNSWYTLLYGRLCFQFNEYDKAMTLFRDILKAHGNKQDVWLNLASAYEEQGLFKEATGVLDTMVMIYGDNDDVTYRRFNLYMNIGEYDKALEEVKILAENFPGDSRFITLLADSYSAAGKDSLAIATYEKATDSSEPFPPAMLGKAELYRKNGDFPNYFKTLQKYMSNRKIAPDSKTEYLELVLNIPSFANYFTADLDTLYAILSSVHPASMEVKTSQALYFIGTGRADQAVTLFARVTDMDTNNKDAWNALLSVLYGLKNSNQLLISSEKAIATDPKYANFYMYNALALWEQKKIKPAINSLETGLKNADYDSLFVENAYTFLGDLYYQSNKRKKAYSFYEKALDRNPQNAMVLNNYAYFLSLDGKNLDKAFTMSSKAIELESSNVSFLDTYAYILYLQKKYKEAKTVFRKALAAGGNNSCVVLDHYADTLDKLGERSNAEIYWSQALEKNDCENKDEIRKKLNQKK